ncbi:TonB-dependent receptor [Thalassotalea mangrovi]|uniref:TonB-dependent receptor n=1 Tax=Thalassotalea mangrovi TaxID=2572245 RepID=A0A4U1B3Y2_9GAMM|nr:TonB-dependent receptor [Thalassotalea mangrovi]TKB44680.1 TonB-dependent receptor [Thalassotalea mangrovi]
MYSNNKLAKSVRLALMFGASATAAISANAFAAEEEAQAEEVERIEVTGSRIKRTDMEGALPVTVIDRTQIDLSGESSVADLLRNTTFNSTGSFRPQSGSSAQGVSSINLRGIGADRTLVLIDGRRLPKSPSTGGTQDLSTIPMAAVERVEILTDGASAAYGSDAIGGVVNIITRKDFNGMEMKLGAAQIEHEGGDREEGSVVFGSSSDTTRVLGGVSWNKRDIVFARDFPWYEPQASVYGNSFGTAEAGYYNWTALPGACNEPDFVILESSGALANSNGEQIRCGFNYANVSADEASTGNLSLFANAEHEINEDWTVFANASVSKSSSFGRYAPVPDAVFVPADSPNNPTNPDSAMYDAAFGENQGVYAWHRFAALGNRDNEVDSEVMDLVVGGSGEVLDNVFVDFGARRTKSKTYDIGRNYLVRSTAAAYLADGTYDLQFPSQNDADVLNAMKATISRISEFNQDEVYASASFDIIELPAGTMQGVVGFEWRDEYYADQYDSLSEAGQIGGSSGNSAGGGRQARGYYFETLIPVIDNLEVTVAGRQDDYSDYGSDFSPKVAVRWEAIDGLVVRGSWGEGFRAPGLDILTQKTAFSADSVNDPITCAAAGQDADCEIQVDAYRIANPNLESEQSEQVALGLAWQPLEWFNFSLDYYSIEITDRIAFFSSQNLIDRAEAGDPIPAGLGVTRNSAGVITQIDTGYGNEGDLETSGFDFNGQFTFEVLGGDLRSNLQVSYMNEYTIDGGRDYVNDPGVPEMRATLSNSFTISDFDFAWNVNYIGDTAEDAGTQEGHIPSWTTHDVQATYNTFFNSKISVGVQNVGGKQPPLFGYDGRDYNFNLYNGYGRITYVRYTQSF